MKRTTPEQKYPSQKEMEEYTKQKFFLTPMYANANDAYIEELNITTSIFLLDFIEKNEINIYDYNDNTKDKLLFELLISVTYWFLQDEEAIESEYEEAIYLPVLYTIFINILRNPEAYLVNMTESSGLYYYIARGGDDILMFKNLINLFQVHDLFFNFINMAHTINIEDTAESKSISEIDEQPLTKAAILVLENLMFISNETGYLHLTKGIKTYRE